VALLALALPARRRRVRRGPAAADPDRPRRRADGLRHRGPPARRAQERIPGSV